MTFSPLITRAAERHGRCSPRSQTPTKASSTSVAELAVAVLAGKHGNGEERTRSLESRYAAVRAEGNRRLRGGMSGAEPVGHGGESR